jgi:hypothetical protein
MRCVGLVLSWITAEGGCRRPSSAVVLDALSPSVENSLLVLTPRFYDAFIPVLPCEQFDALPVHLLVVAILSKVESIRIGRSIMLVGLPRCGME